MSCQLRARSPCGAKLLVSKPNQATPVNCTSCPLPLTTFPPTVRRATALPAPPGAGGGTALAGAGYGVALLCGAPAWGALHCGALPSCAAPFPDADGALPCGA